MNKQESVQAATNLVVIHSEMSLLPCSVLRTSWKRAIPGVVLLLVALTLMSGVLHSHLQYTNTSALPAQGDSRRLNHDLLANVPFIGDDPSISHVHVIWNNNDQWFQFRHLLSLLSVAKYVSPFRLFIHYSKSAGKPASATDDYLATYHTWLNEAVSTIHILNHVVEDHWDGIYTTEQMAAAAVDIMNREKSPFMVITSSLVLHPDVSRFLRSNEAVRSCVHVPGRFLIASHVPCQKVVNKTAMVTLLDRGTLAYSIDDLIIATEMPSWTSPRASLQSPLEDAKIVRDLYYDSREAIPPPERHAKTVIPAIAHYIWFGQLNVTFFGMLSVVSVLDIGGMDAVVVHGDNEPVGKYWEMLQKTYGARLSFHRYVAPDSVWSKTIGHVFHKSDIARVELLRRYGGFYLDWDVIVVKNVQEFLHYDAVIGVDMLAGIVEALQTSVMFSKPEGKFLAELIHTYRDYNDSRWNYLCCILPAKVSEKHPRSILVEPQLAYQVFGRSFRAELLSSRATHWQQYYSYHVINPKPDIETAYDGVFGDLSVTKLQTTFGDIVRHVLSASAFRSLL